VVVCTLPSAGRALRENHPALEAFLGAAGDRLAVVFDEAHHAPAPTYVRLLQELRERCPAPGAARPHRDADLRGGEPARVAEEALSRRTSCTTHRSRS
jgi:superfamily II DNA or RNA helicase